jgi:hypothetical protein
VAENTLKRERKAGHDPDERSWAAVEAKRRWLAGEISDDELAAARAAAWDAAKDAAWDAASAAAWDAASAAAWDAAKDAAWDAAWDAAKDAAKAAKDAAKAAAKAAAWAAAWDKYNRWLEQMAMDAHRNKR